MVEWIKTNYPCHGGVVKLARYHDVPKEIYTRTCIECGFHWEIGATSFVIKNTGPLCGATVNVIVWGKLED